MNKNVPVLYIYLYIEIYVTYKILSSKLEVHFTVCTVIFVHTVRKLYNFAVKSR